MNVRQYRFDRFMLDPNERRLFADESPVALNSRYFDALLLLLQHPGKLVSKERFLREVWLDIPVTDEVLTQCIKTLRRQLGDSAAQPRLIETIPKHGYRFIATVHCVTDVDIAPEAPEAAAASQVDSTTGADDWRQCWLAVGAGMTGGGVSGVLGGLAFGFVAAAHGPAGGVGSLSTLLVLVALATLLCLIGAAGVVGGIAAARLVARKFPFAGLVGGATGGLLVGAFGKLIGQDTFLLLFGHSPGDITGAFEGLLLGAAVGLADDLARRFSAGWSIQRHALLAALLGGLAGLLIAATGGRLFGGSLSLLAEGFPGAHLRLDLLGRFAANVTSALEGSWFSLCLVGALLLARRWVRVADR